MWKKRTKGSFGSGVTLVNKKREREREMLLLPDFARCVRMLCRQRMRKRTGYLTEGESW